MKMGVYMFLISSLCSMPMQCHYSTLCRYAVNLCSDWLLHTSTFEWAGMDCLVSYCSYLTSHHSIWPVLASREKSVNGNFLVGPSFPANSNCSPINLSWRECKVTADNEWGTITSSRYFSDIDVSRLTMPHMKSFDRTIQGCQTDIWAHGDR